MGIDDLWSADINLDVAREAHAQAQRMLEDIMATKNAFETKACALLGGYVAIALALASSAGIATADPALRFLAAHLLIGALFFTCGSLCFLVSLSSMTYGTIGSSPSQWLRRGVIDGKNELLARNLACITFQYSRRIEQSNQNNDRKARAIQIGIYCGALAPLYLMTIVALYLL